MRCRARDREIGRGRRNARPGVGRWTTREGIISFFAPDAKIEPKVGGAFQIYFNPLAEPGLKGADDMRFMALQPKQMLSFDWNAPPHLPAARQQRTFVVGSFCAGQ